MGDPADLDALADACIKAMEAVRAHGTPEMERVMRLLLFQVGNELAKPRRAMPRADGPEDDG